MDRTGVIPMAGLNRNKENDVESLIGIARLDRDAVLKTIIRENSADISRLANRLLGWPSDVDDVVQDVFLAAFTGLKRFRGDCDMKTWLFTITINKCRTYKYKKMLRLKFFERISKDFSNQTASSASEKPIKDEIYESVRKAVPLLPVKYREAVVLKYLQELKTSDIMKILGITENTLNVRLSRAKNFLNQKLLALMEG